MRYLKYAHRKLDLQELQGGTPVALVDSQPGAGNNPLPDQISPLIVIDHHTLNSASLKAKYADVRPRVGATATIITEYLQSAGLEIPPYLATALFYGIKTDTMGLGRNASQSDKSAYLFLQPKVDVDALVLIERAQVPVTYFQSLNSAMSAARVYDGDLVISYVGEMRYPDLVAEIADLLMRLQGVNLVICMGAFKREFLISMRSRSQRFNAGELAQRIIGGLGTAGGHGTMAGGQIHMSSYDPLALVDKLTFDTLQYVKGDGSLNGKPFI